MKMVPIAITRLRRGFNSVGRRLISRQVDAYIVTHRTMPVVSLVSYEKADQWLQDLEQIQALIGELKQLYRDELGVEPGGPAADSEGKA